TTATAQAQATAAAQAAAQVAAATATAAGQANATATAAANAAALATQTAAANAAGTATAQAQPSATPVPPTATKPAPTRTPVANWGPVLAPLEGGKVYNDPAGRFSFRVPQDWTKTDTPPANTEVAFVAPGNLPNMNVGLEDVSKASNVTLDRYNQASEDQLKKLSGYTPVSLTKVVVDNHPAYKRVFKATVSGRDAQFEQVYFLDNNTAHVQTFTTLPQNFAQ